MTRKALSHYGKTLKYRIAMQRFTVIEEVIPVSFLACTRSSAERLARDRRPALTLQRDIVKRNRRPIVAFRPLIRVSRVSRRAYEKYP